MIADPVDREIQQRSSAPARAADDGRSAELKAWATVHGSPVYISTEPRRAFVFVKYAVAQQVIQTPDGAATGVRAPCGRTADPAADKGGDPSRTSPPISRGIARRTRLGVVAR